MKNTYKSLPTVLSTTVKSQMIYIRSISLSSPDNQCSHGRSGILCGECKDNKSIILGSSKCRDCASTYNFIWLTIVFAVAGLALVAFLLSCNITISAGTLNGLIFYVNVVSIGEFINPCPISPIISVFIALILEWRLVSIQA